MKTNREKLKELILIICLAGGFAYFAETAIKAMQTFADYYNKATLIY